MSHKQEKNPNARYPDLNRPGPLTLSKEIERRMKKKRPEEDIQWNDTHEDGGAHKQHSFALENKPQSKESADAAATLMSHYSDAVPSPAQQEKKKLNDDKLPDVKDQAKNDNKEQTVS